MLLNIAGRSLNSGIKSGIVIGSPPIIDTCKSAGGNDFLSNPPAKLPRYRRAVAQHSGAGIPC